MAPKERRQPVRAAAVVSAVSEDYVSRRVKRHLNDLERSNYTEPTSGPSTYGAGEDGEEKAPTALGKPGEEDGQGRKRKKATNAVRQLLMYRKTLAALLEESNLATLPKSQSSYLTAVAPPSRLPPLHLCSICGFKGRYGCQRCGLKYCDRGCRAIHDDERCERR